MSNFEMFCHPLHWRSSLKIWLVMAALIPVAGARAQSASHECPTTTFFSFQVDAQARFTGDSTLSVHPTPTTRNPANLVQFVVDSTGEVVLDTFKALKTSDHALVQRASESLNQWHYTPATLGGCHVRQVIQTPIGP
jgi:hypothetical protein